MPKGDRYRSRLFPRDRAEYFKDRSSHNAEGIQLNRNAHNRAHTSKVVTYTTTSTLTTTAGSPIYPPQPISLVAMSINVAGAPASTLTCDLLLNGTSVYGTGWSKPTIAAGALYGGPARIVGTRHVLPINGDYLQVKLTATGSATGPLVAYITYRYVK